MRLSPTLSIYLGRHFLVGVATVLGGLLLLIYLGELVELLRRAAARDDVPISTLMQMAMLRAPTMTQKILPFAILIATILSFTRLTRSQELIVARAAGVSVWQFMLPALSIAIAVALATIMILNPLGSATLTRYERLEGRYLKGQSSTLTVGAHRLWLRQSDGDGQSVIHAVRAADQGQTLYEVTVFSFKTGDKFFRRIDADVAHLEPGQWRLEKAVLTSPTSPSSDHVGRYDLPTNLSLKEIQSSLASPETMSFWALPSFIATMEEAGFTALRHKLFFFAALALPVLSAAMVLVGASFSLRLTRKGGTAWLMAAGVSAGFLLYFLSDLVLALGQSGNIPALVAAWTPAAIALMLGVASIMFLEDG